MSVTPVHSLVAIARNGWSRSIGIGGRNQSESVVAISRCAQIGSIAHPTDRNGEFFWPFGIGLILTCAVFVFTPALGKVGHVGGYIDTLTTIRSGLWTVLDYSRAEGIVTFPSFHATLAVLFVYAVRRHRLVLVVFVPLNVLLIAATPTVGGHFLVDLPAGVIVAVASIAVTRALRRRLFASQARVQICFREGHPCLPA